MNLNSTRSLCFLASGDTRRAYIRHLWQGRGDISVRILKFGGSSLADAERLRASAGIVAAHLREAPVVTVISAMAGVTDALLRAASAHLAGDDSWRSELAAVEAQHRTAYEALTGSVPVAFESTWRELIADLAGLASAGVRPGSVEARFAGARFSGWGERLVVPLFAAALAGSDVLAQPFTAEPVLLETHASPRETPRPSILATRGWLVPRLARLVMRGGVPVLPGYIARDAAGQVTTLGRNGSDYSAAVVAAALGAQALYIYSDVAGLYTADPRVVRDAALLPEVTYVEATEVAWLGARVLHPRALAPLAHWHIPLYLRSSLAPGVSGTTIVPTRIGDIGGAWVVAARPLGDDQSERLVEVSATLLGVALRTLDNGEPLLMTAARMLSQHMTHQRLMELTPRQLRVRVPAAVAEEVQRLIHGTLAEAVRMAVPAGTRLMAV